MDSGFNMLGQFQGDSSLGLGSFQGNSEPSIQPTGFSDRSLSDPLKQDTGGFSENPTFCSDIFPVVRTGYYSNWDNLNED